jgi:hypothetical protein
MSPALDKSKNGTVDDARLQSLLAAKERLIRDEFERKYQNFAVEVKRERNLIRDELERKYQDLAVEVKRERNRYTEEVQKLKRQLSNCICGASAKL